MKILAIVAAISFCLPLWAEEDLFINLPTTFLIEVGNRVSYGKFGQQIFNFRASHNGIYVNQIDMDWALAPVEASLTTHWTFGISAQYFEEPTENRMKLVGQYAKSPGMYFLVHHITSRDEVRFYYPLANRIDGQDLFPWFELERLRLVDITPSTQLYLRGETGFNHPSSISIGIRQGIGPLELKARTDGAWSIGANTDF